MASEIKPKIKEKIVRSQKSDILTYSVDHIPADIRRKAMYSTDLADSYPGCTPEVGEEFRSKSVHSIHTFSPNWNKVPAPFWKRDLNCRYNTEYIPLPLDGAPINRALAKTFAPAQYVAESGKIGDATVHKLTYTEHPGYHKSEAITPAVQVHVSKAAKLLRKSTTTHENFPGVEVNEMTCRPPQITPFVSSSATGFKLDGRPRYDEDFNVYIPEKWDFKNSNEKGAQKSVFIDRENSMRTMGAQVPAYVQQKIIKRREASERLSNLKNTPLFKHYDWETLLQHPDIDPFDANLEEAMKTGQVKKLNFHSLESQAARDIKTLQSPEAHFTLLAPLKEETERLFYLNREAAAVKGTSNTRKQVQNNNSSDNNDNDHHHNSVTKTSNLTQIDDVVNLFFLDPSSHEACAINISPLLPSFSPSTQNSIIDANDQQNLTPDARYTAHLLQKLRAAEIPLFDSNFNLVDPSTLHIISVASRPVPRIKSSTQLKEALEQHQRYLTSNSGSWTSPDYLALQFNQGVNERRKFPHGHAKEYNAFLDSNASPSSKSPVFEGNRVANAHTADAVLRHKMSKSNQHDVKLGNQTGGNNSILGSAVSVSSSSSAFVRAAEMRNGNTSFSRQGTASSLLGSRSCVELLKAGRESALERIHSEQTLARSTIGGRVRGSGAAGAPVSLIGLSHSASASTVGKGKARDLKKSQSMKRMMMTTATTNSDRNQNNNNNNHLVYSSVPNAIKSTLVSFERPSSISSKTQADRATSSTFNTTSFEGHWKDSSPQQLRGLGTNSSPLPPVASQSPAHINMNDSHSELRQHKSPPSGIRGQKTTAVNHGRREYEETC